MSHAQPLPSSNLMGQAETPAMTVMSDESHTKFRQLEEPHEGFGLRKKKSWGFQEEVTCQLVLEGGIGIFTRKHRDKEDNSEQRAWQVQR